MNFFSFFGSQWSLFTSEVQVVIVR